MTGCDMVASSTSKYHARGEVLRHPLTNVSKSLAERAVEPYILKPHSEDWLLHTLWLPPGPRGDENWLTAEPRVLADGRTVMVNRGAVFARP
jgi:hypothetical protein